ncbi:hypothetical protein TNCV_4373471 [Trichonephila clavipes]|uniref:Uncharacterized protein n=1 Tax=Trichonephila clavipes TaxID=2585209 RepID=A0A8X6RE30_TRICX|nr:hypothetical protein TNCV_4373471 [Trichonephila clavipes]
MPPYAILSPLIEHVSTPLSIGSKSLGALGPELTISLRARRQARNDSSDLASIVQNHPFKNAIRELFATDHVILNHGQVTRTTPELAPPTTPTGGRFSSRQI